MNHVEIDLETLGSRAGCAILSIGAVGFDPDAQKLGDTFYEVVQRESCKAAGLHEDADTLKWWEKQSPTAKVVIAMAEDPKQSTPLKETLEKFNEYVLEQGPVRDTCVWSNGADFDLPILIAAYHAVGLVPAWKFFNHRCHRTLKNNPYFKVAPPPRSGTAHHALNDACHQAEHAMAILMEMQRASQRAT